MKIYEKLQNMAQERAGYFCLLDPDNFNGTQANELAALCEENGADGILVGGSMMFHDRFEENLRKIKESVKAIPVLIFPGLFNFVSPYADALLLISMISSRNAQMLIGEQVRATPLIRKYGLEAIGTGYILIDGGKPTSVQYMSHSMPIPHDKDDIAAVHALTAEYLGHRLVYMDSGSGAADSISESMIRCVKREITIPLVVGGGIRNPETARAKAIAGADFIVTGNVLEKDTVSTLIREFAEAVHSVTRK
ncbi:MAG: geranylgeranylglyceryl/heptaprenylglyceryl phosphate synthase [Candidatus Cloacimonetes bacterium]|nr:geranylgeranylglyceryl/heptaprenylglyceryl phosphate synthase [Candidatus Cloacimonadota bacterium]